MADAVGPAGAQRAHPGRVALGDVHVHAPQPQHDADGGQRVADVHGRAVVHPLPHDDVAGGEESSRFERVRGEVAALPLKGVIDIGAERTRLQKEMAKADADIARSDAKLNNPKFVERAAEEVVDEERGKRDEAVARKAKIAEALERLKGAEEEPEHNISGSASRRSFGRRSGDAQKK